MEDKITAGSLLKTAQKPDVTTPKEVTAGDLLKKKEPSESTTLLSSGEDLLSKIPEEGIKVDYPLTYFQPDQQPKTPPTTQELNRQAQKLANQNLPTKIEDVAKITEDKSQLHTQAYSLATMWKLSASNAVADILLQKHPDDFYAHQLKANNYLQDNKPELAVSELDIAIAKQPDYPQLYSQRAVAKQRAGQDPKMDAMAYIQSVGTAGGDKNIANELSNMYALSGDTEKAKYWRTTYNSLVKEDEQNAYAATIRSFPDWFYTQAGKVLKPLTLPVEMGAAGVEKIGEAVSKMNPMLPSEKVVTEALPELLQGGVDLYFAALGSTPAGLVFNTVISAGEMVGAEEITNWAMAPVSQILAKSGVDETKLNKWAQLGVTAGNILPIMLFAHGKQALGEKLLNKEPIKGDEIKQIDEAIVNTTPEQINEAVKLTDDFISGQEKAKEVSEAQKLVPDQPTYRIGETLYTSKEAFLSDLMKAKENGAKKVDWEVNLDETTANEAIELFRPRVQQEMGVQQMPEVPMSDVAKTTLDKLQNGEKVLNIDIEATSKELYERRKGLEKLKGESNRYSPAQIDQSINALEDIITTLEELKNAQAEAGEFVLGADQFVVKKLIEDKLAELKEFKEPEKPVEVVEKPVEVAGEIKEPLTETTAKEPISSTETTKVEPLKEETNAITEGKITENNQQEHQGVPQGENLQGNKAEVRGEESQQTGGGGGVEPSPEKAVKQKFQSAADKLRSFKIQEGISEPTTLGISDTKLWNDAIEIAAKTIETTGDVAQAIADGLSKLSTKEDKDKFEAMMRENFAPQPSKARMEDTARMREEAGLGESIRQSVGDVEVNRQKAIELINNGEVDMPELVKRAKEGGGVSTIEMAVLDEYVLGMHEKYKLDPSKENLDRLRDAIEASEQAGATASGAMNVRRVIIDPEKGIADAIIDAERMLGVRRLTPEQELAQKEWFDKFTKLKEEQEKRIAEFEEELARVRAEKELKTQRKNRTPRRTREQFVAERDKLIQEAKDNWAKASKSNVLSATIVPVPYAQQLYAISPQVLGLFKLYASEAGYKLADIVTKIKDDLGLSEIKDKDIIAIIDGDYKEVPKRNKSEVAIEIENRRREAHELNTLEKLLNGIDPKKEITPKQNKQISDVQKRINDLRKQQRKPQLTPEELEAKRANTRIKTERTRIEKEIEQLKKELAGAPPKPKPEKINYPKDIIERRRELNALREQRKAKLILDQYNSQTLWQKIKKDATALLRGTTKALIATGDLSVAFLQLGLASLSHPMQWGRSLAKSIDFARSEKKHIDWVETESRTRDWAILKEAGMDLPDPTRNRLLSQEELLSNDIIDRVPILGRAVKIKGKGYGGITKAAQRQFIGMGDALRYGLGKALIARFESKGFTLENNPEMYKAAVEWINTLGSRSKGNRATEETLKTLGNFLWAPRMYYSQLKALTALGNKKFMLTHPEVTKMVLRDWGTYVGLSALILGVSKAAGADVELDLASKDFGTIRIGNIRIGLPGGMIKWLATGYQLAAGEQKSTTTERTKYLGEGTDPLTRGKILGREVRGKLSPTMGLLADIVLGDTYMGDDVTLKGELNQRMWPMAWRNAVEAVQNEGAVSGSALGTAGAMGLPVRSYPNTGIYPTESLAGLKNTNALGEETNKYDKGVWDTFNKYKIYVKPKPRSQIKEADVENIKNKPISEEQYKKYVELRGDAIKQMGKTLQGIEPYKEQYINQLMNVKFADGSLAIKDRKTAEKILENVLIPNAAAKHIKKISDAAREAVITQKPFTQPQLDVLRVIEEYEGWSRGGGNE